MIRKHEQSTFLYTMTNKTNDVRMIHQRFHNFQLHNNAFYVLFFGIVYDTLKAKTC